MAVAIVTDSTADLPAPVVAEYGIHVVPLTVRFGEAVYRDGVDLLPDQFFALLAQSAVLPRTSQPSPGDFEEAYRAASAAHDAILSIHISARLSGTLHSAQLASQSLAGGRPIELIDSGLASMAVGLVVAGVAAQARAGAGLADLAALARDLASRTRLLVMVDTLEYLAKGGRIGKAQAFLGSLLGVKPLITLRDGELHPYERARTRRRGLDRLAEFAGDQGPVESLAVLHGTTPQDAQALLDRLASLCPREQSHLARYGPVIGTHIGPGAVGVAVTRRG